MDCKQPPKYVFKFPEVESINEQRRLTRAFKKAFGKNIVLIFGQKIEMYQLTDSYKKVF